MTNTDKIQCVALAMLEQIAEVGPLRTGSDRPKLVTARVNVDEGSTHEWLRGIAAALEPVGWEITGLVCHPWEGLYELSIGACPTAATYRAALAAKVTA